MHRQHSARLVLSVSTLLVMAGASAPAAAQTPTSLSSTASFNTPSGKTPKSLGSNNEWIVGTQLGAKFYGNGDIADNLLVSGMIRYDIPLNTGTTEFGLPIFSNLGAIIDRITEEGSTKDSIDSAVGSLVSSASGLSVGLYPYWVFPQRALNGNVRVTLFGQSVAKLNAFEGRPSVTAPDTAAKVVHRLLQGRGALGLEFAVGSGDDNYKPLTVSVTGVSTTTSGRTYELIFGERKSTIWSLEISAVAPVRTGAGVLLEGIAIRDHSPAWRVGMIVALGKAAAKDAIEEVDDTPTSTSSAEKQAKCLQQEKTKLPTATDDDIRATQGYKDCVAVGGLRS